MAPAEHHDASDRPVPDLTPLMSREQTPEADLPTTPIDTGFPETRVLVIGTGGTICMQQGPDGLQPSEGFLDSAMAPRPSFNDRSHPRCTSPRSSFESHLTRSPHLMRSPHHIYP